MKNFTTVFTFTFLITLITPGIATAQDCRFFFPTEEGTLLEMTYYNKRGKTQSVQNMKVLDKEQKGDATVVTVKQTMETGKNEDLNTTYTVKCEDGKFYMDMESMVSNLNMNQFNQPNMEMEITSDGIVFPSDLEPGMDLPPATIEFSIGSGGMNMMNTTITMKNRKVEGKESVTTPAGTFDCYKISYDTETKSMMTNVKTSNVLWLAENVGVVRSESYNKRGKLDGFQELTKISR